MDNTSTTGSLKIQRLDNFIRGLTIIATVLIGASLIGMTTYVPSEAEQRADRIECGTKGLGYSTVSYSCTEGSDTVQPRVRLKGD